MDANYNELHLPIQCKGKYKEGDIFKLSERDKRAVNWRVLKCDGLRIESIRYFFGVVLLFNRHEWSENDPETTEPKLKTNQMLNNIQNHGTENASNRG